MSFGPKMRIEFDGLGVTLRPFEDGDLHVVADGFSSMKALMFTKQLYAQTFENEKEWYDKVRIPGTSDLVWAIVPDGSDVPVGSTGVHHLAIASHACKTGIVIWDEKFREKGVGTRAHLGRTLYIADFLNMFVIESSVRAVNEPSRKALERVGYMATGLSPRTAYRQGKYLDTLIMTWLNPKKIGELYPEGLPDEYRPAVEKADGRLEFGRKVVEFL